MTTKVCEPLQSLISVRTYWTWNRMYQDLHNKGKKIGKKDAYMKFYNMARPLYLETDTSSTGLGVDLLQVRNSMNCRHNEMPDNAILCLITFTSKSLSKAECHYSNIECSYMD